jgi:nucleolar protein 56
MDISPIDLINIQMFASRVIDMFDYRKRLQEYLNSKINQVAPNLSGLIGDQVISMFNLSSNKNFQINH